MNNNACIGYVIIAMKIMGFDKKEMEKVIDGLYIAFDEFTEREAEERTHKEL